MSYVVEQGQDENGTWYRRFSNGWAEQGGYATGPSRLPAVVVLPVEFANTSYYVNFTGEMPGVNPYDDVYLRTVQDKTTTGFAIKDYMVTAQPFSWEAKGFAA